MLNILKLYIEYIISFWNQNHSLLLVLIRFHLLYHSLLSVVIRYHSLYHSLSLVVSIVVSIVVSLLCGSLSLVVIRFHSLSFVVTRCHSLYYTLSLVVTRYHSLYHSLSLFVTGCTTRLLFCKRSKSSQKSFQKFKTTRTHYFINQRSYPNISPINRQKHLLVAIS